MLTGLNASEISPPQAGEYQYIGVILIVLIAVELAREVQPRTMVVAIALVVSVAAAMSNLAYLREVAQTLGATTGRSWAHWQRSS